MRTSAKPKRVFINAPPLKSSWKFDVGVTLASFGPEEGGRRIASRPVVSMSYPCTSNAQVHEEDILLDFSAFCWIRLRCGRDLSGLAETWIRGEPRTRAGGPEPRAFRV